jgi:hypothetical protein
VLNGDNQNDAVVADFCAEASCVHFYAPTFTNSPIGYDLVERCTELGIDVSVQVDADVVLGSIFDHTCEPYEGGVCERFGYPPDTPVYVRTSQAQAESFLALQNGLSANNLPECRTPHMWYMCGLYMPKCHTMDVEGQAKHVPQQICKDSCQFRFDAFCVFPPLQSFL